AGRWCSCRLHIKLLNWSAFFTLVAEFGLDPRVVVRSVTEEGSAKWAGKISPKCLSLSWLSRVSS
ncbi:MAG TPA: hypothetical protein VJ023_22530, partial [Pyrinomonadaceae bacterium]|nr:hypothetical protein [Pyrinomonadaceae bacterium]